MYVWTSVENSLTQDQGAQQDDKDGAKEDARGQSIYGHWEIEFQNKIAKTAKQIMNIS